MTTLQTSGKVISTLNIRENFESVQISPLFSPHGGQKAKPPIFTDKRLQFLNFKNDNSKVVSRIQTNGILPCHICASRRSQAK